MIVAKHKEDTGWTEHVPDDWKVWVIEKDKDLPNMGREPNTFLYAILKLYKGLKDDDLVACVQGNPLDHCPGIVEELIEGTDSAKPLGHEMFVCGGDGEPQHSGLPVAPLYESWLGKPFPRRVQFNRGGQFMVTGKLIKNIPAAKYREMFKQTIDDDRVPYVFERLWLPLFLETDKQTTE